MFLTLDFRQRRRKGVKHEADKMTSPFPDEEMTFLVQSARMSSNHSFCRSIVSKIAFACLPHSSPTADNKPALAPGVELLFFF